MIQSGKSFSINEEMVAAISCLRCNPRMIQSRRTHLYDQAESYFIEKGLEVGFADSGWAERGLVAVA